MVRRSRRMYSSGTKPRLDRSFFGDLFKKKESPAPKGKPRAAGAVPSAGDKMIQVFDAYGRAMQIPPEEWRTKVPPGTLRAQWNGPPPPTAFALCAEEDLPEALSSHLADELPAHDKAGEQEHQPDLEEPEAESGKADCHFVI